MTKYISLFSGAGGFEHPHILPQLVCESDPVCGRVLHRRMPNVPLHNDVVTLTPPQADFVVGGWPCQDISSAGNQIGIDGLKSGLFFRMVEIAKESKAHTLIGENVPNLLTVNKGEDFHRVLHTLETAGYPYISWRTLNVRQFGLPQERNRVFIVASKNREFPVALHSSEPNSMSDVVKDNPASSGFYWTAGGRSVCLSQGFTPALKVGASDSKGRSVVAIFRNGLIRKLSPQGCARLQGFSVNDFKGESKTNVVRMAGNAVAVPMGQFVLASVFKGGDGSIGNWGSGLQIGYRKIMANGFYEKGIVWGIRHPSEPLATNLDDFVVDDPGELLSGQAAAGLIVRTARSGKLLPTELFEALLQVSEGRLKMRGSRANSFEALDKLDIEQYRRAMSLGIKVLNAPETTETWQPSLFAM